MATVDFYNTTSKRNEVNKTLTNKTTLTVRITSPAEDIMNPILEMSAIHSGYNYAVLNGRKYFIVRREQLLDSRERLYLEEDVLSTWYDNCSISGIVEQSSEKYNMDLKQNFPKQVNAGIKRIVFDDMQPNLGSTIIAQSTYNYALKPTQ